MSFLEDLLGLPRKKGQEAGKKAAVNAADAKQQAAIASPLSIDDELEKAWDYVQKRLYCFELQFPKLVESDEVETACISMKSHEISIQKKFVDHLRGKGLDYQTIFRGLLLHEAGHYKIMPWDLKNMIMLTYRIEKACPEKKDELSNYFMDVCLNLELMLDKREDSIRRIYQKLDKSSNTEAVLSHLYAFKTGMDFDVPTIGKGLRQKVDELGKIKFTSRKRAYQNAERFARILAELDEQEKQEGNKGKSSSGKSGGYSLSKVDGFGLGAYDEKEVERALKDIAKELEKPDNYKKLHDFVRQEQERLKGQETGAKDDGLSDVGKPGATRKGLPIAGSGRSRAPGRDPKDALIDFYNAKAESYEILVEDRDVIGGGENASTQLKPWEIDEPVARVDVFNSYGKYLPEISKSWNEEGSRGEKKTKGTPDLLVMIDSSCSMADPAEELSYAALGGVCAARQYLRKGSKVAVVNFSSETKASNFLDDPRKVSKNILHYQEGGTRLETEKMHEVLSRNKNSVDIMLISDGYIYNYDEVMRGLVSKKNTNRITVLEIASGFCFGGFSGDTGRFRHKKIQLYTIKDETDIPGIVVGDMGRNGVM
ncbi:hypothetical protein JXB28_01200 [Candidatus Woesearchaeota archaeon]|nr:hypothetical protein [Candidatus Woesearchaeota archaeon]